MLTPFPPNRLFSLSLRIMPYVQMLADSMFLLFVLPENTSCGMEHLSLSVRSCFWATNVACRAASIAME
jgi:hypothetical protein